MKMEKRNRREAHSLFSLPVNNKQGNCSAITTEKEEMKNRDSREMFVFNSRAFADFHFKFFI